MNGLGRSGHQSSELHYDAVLSVYLGVDVPVRWILAVIVEGGEIRYLPLVCRWVLQGLLFQLVFGMAVAVRR